VDVGFGVELLAGQVRGGGEAVHAVGRCRFGEVEDDRGRPDGQVARPRLGDPAVLAEPDGGGHSAHPVVAAPPPHLRQPPARAPRRGHRAWAATPPARTPAPAPRGNTPPGGPRRPPSGRPPPPAPPSTASTAGISPAGSACTMLPTVVPRLRMAAWATNRS